MSYHDNRVTAHSITRFTVFALLLLQSSLAAAVSTTQLDSFSDGTSQGWEMGVPGVTATHMTIITDGGPAGAGDNFLQVVADGTSDAGGRLTFLNSAAADWNGLPVSATLGIDNINAINFTSISRGSGFPATKRSCSNAVSVSPRSTAHLTVD